MRVPEIIKHPIETARIAPTGVSMIILGTLGEAGVVDNAIGGDMPPLESFALGGIFANSLALGSLAIAVKRRQLNERNSSSSPLDSM